MTDATTSITENCRNCAAPLGPQTPYCAQCGQRQVERRVSLFTLTEEFFTNFFNVDSKLFQTVRGLFRPGHLTTEYFSGRRQRYASPVRLFLIVTGLLLATASLITQWKTDADFNSDFDEVKETAAFALHMELLDSVATAISLESSGRRQLLPTLDSLQRRMWEESGYYYPDSVNSTIITLTEMRSLDRQLAVADIVYLEADSIIELYGITDPDEQLGVRRTQRFMQQGGALFSYSIGKLFWALLLIVPLAALAFQLLYLRRGRFYVEHFVFLLHWHTWFYLLSIPVLFLMWYLDQFPAWVVLLAVPYLWLALRRYYGQSPVKTTLKLLPILVAYVAVIIVLVLVWFFASVLTF